MRRPLQVIGDHNSQVSKWIHLHNWDRIDTDDNGRRILISIDTTSNIGIKRMLLVRFIKVDIGHGVALITATLLLKKKRENLLCVCSLYKMHDSSPKHPIAL